MNAKLSLINKAVTLLKVYLKQPNDENAQKFWDFVEETLQAEVNESSLNAVGTGIPMEAARDIIKVKEYEEQTSKLLKDLAWLVLYLSDD